MNRKEYIIWLQNNIKISKEVIIHQQNWLLSYIKKLQEICSHDNVIELPTTVYSGIAKGYAKRFCTICRLEESENNGFHKILKAHKVLNDINNAIRLADYMEYKDDNIR